MGITASQEVAEYKLFKSIIAEKAVGPHKDEIAAGIREALENGVSVKDLADFSKRTKTGTVLWKTYHRRHLARWNACRLYDFSHFVNDVLGGRIKT